MADFQLLSTMPFVTLETGMTLTLEAIDPDTGAAVAGVVISSATIYVSTSGPGEELPAVAPYLAITDGAAEGGA